MLTDLLYIPLSAILYPRIFFYKFLVITCGNGVCEKLRFSRISSAGFLAWIYQQAQVSGKLTLLEGLRR